MLIFNFVLVMQNACRTKVPDRRGRRANSANVLRKQEEEKFREWQFINS